MNILGTASYKTKKGEKDGYLTGILYLAPADEIGIADKKHLNVNLCPGATAECRQACLFTAGRGVMSNVYSGRIRKTKMFLEDRETFKDQLREDIKALIRQGQRENLIPCVRLNGTSDIVWEKYAADIMSEFSDIQFYDYTKLAGRFKKQLPANYHLTFSRSGENDHDCIQLLEAGHNVAVVFSGELPEAWQGFKVVDGDKNDLRFLDGKGVVVGLKAKGRARGASVGGFVVQS
jgi:hypothetical protein